MKMKACCVQVYLVFRVRAGRSIPAIPCEPNNGTTLPLQLGCDLMPRSSGKDIEQSILLLQCPSSLTVISFCHARGAAVRVRQHTQSAQKRARSSAKGGDHSLDSSSDLPQGTVPSTNPRETAPGPSEAFTQCELPRENTSGAVGLPGAPSWLWHEVGRLLSHGKYVLVETVLSRKGTPGGSQWFV